MPEISLTEVLVVAAVAFLVPLGLGLFPSVRVPSVVVEILAGVLIGPAVLGLVEVDLPLEVLALIGLAFLLFLAGSEIDLERLRGGRLRAAVGALVPPHRPDAPAGRRKSRLIPVLPLPTRS